MGTFALCVLVFVFAYFVGRMHGYIGAVKAEAVDTGETVEEVRQRWTTRDWNVIAKYAAMQNTAPKTGKTRRFDKPE